MRFCYGSPSKWICGHDSSPEDIWAQYFSTGSSLGAGSRGIDNASPPLLAFGCGLSVALWNVSSFPGFRPTDARSAPSFSQLITTPDISRHYQTPTRKQNHPWLRITGLERGNRFIKQIITFGIQFCKYSWSTKFELG